MATRSGVSVSAFAHLAIILVAVIGLHGASSPDTPTEESIAVDLVPMAPSASIRAGTLKSKLIKTETPSAVKDTRPAKLAEPTGNTHENQPKPQQTDTPSPKPVVNSAPKPAPEPPPKPTPIVKPTPKPAPPPAPAPEPKPVPTPSPAPKPTPTPKPDASIPELVAPSDAQTDVAAPQPVRSSSIDEKRAALEKEEKQAAKAKAEADAEARKAAKAEADAEAAKAAQAKKRKADEAAKVRADKAAKAAAAISSIINQDTATGATTGAGGTPTTGKPTGKAATLTQSEIGAMAAQIRQCWNLLPSEIEANLSVHLLVNMGRDGNVIGVPRIEDAGTSPMAGSISRSAQRAVVECGPYKLDPAKYGAWSQLEVVLNTNQ